MSFENQFNRVFMVDEVGEEPSAEAIEMLQKRVTHRSRMPASPKHAALMEKLYKECSDSNGHSKSCGVIYNEIIWDDAP